MSEPKQGAKQETADEQALRIWNEMPCAEDMDGNIIQFTRLLRAEWSKGQEPVATKLVSDPYDERDGPWFSLQDLERLRKLPAGTRLYAAPVAKPAAQETIAGLQKQIGDLQLRLQWLVCGDPSKGFTFPVTKDQP